MNKKNIENKIKNAFEAVTPAKLDDVLGCCAEQMAENREKKAPVTVPLPRRNRVRWAQAGALALVMLCVSSAFMLNGRRASEVVIGSTETGNTESITFTESFESSERESVADTESSTAVGMLPETIDGTVSESTEDTLTELTESPVIEPTETPTQEPTGITVIEPTEVPATEPTEVPVIQPTEGIVIEPTETPTQEPMENTENDVADTTESVGGDSTTSGNTGDAYCPMPDPAYRELRGAISDAVRQLVDEASSTYYPAKHYVRKDAVYVYAWLGEADGETVYYVTYCIGKHRIDCKIPVIYKEEITDFTITPLVERGPDEAVYIGSDSAKSMALTAAGVSEGSVDALTVSIDRFKEHPSYHVTFYYNGSRYFYDLDAVSGKLLFQNVYDLTAMKKFIKEQQESPYYIEPELLSDDLLFDRIKSVIRAAETSTTDRSTCGLFVERVTDIVNDDILDVHYKDNSFICKGELTSTDGYMICFEESKIEKTSNISLEFKYLIDALNSAGINDNDVIELTAELNGEIYDIGLKTKKNVYKFGIWKGLRPPKSSAGNITYFGKAPVGKETEMVLLTADSALQKALDDAGVTEYTLVESESVKHEFGVGKDLRCAYYYDITFKSGEYTYKYKVDVFTGKADKYLSGSGKGDVSDVIYSIGDRTGDSVRKITILCNAAQKGFSEWFDGCKLDMIWIDKGELSELNQKYADYYYANTGRVVGIRFTTGADYNGNYGFKPNTKYNMYLLLYDNYNINWQVIGFVFE